MLNRFAVCMILILVVSGCETAPRKSPVVTPQPMSCGINGSASITLYSPEEARLVFKNAVYDLKRLKAEFGIKYGNESITYWNKGINAVITHNNGIVTGCTYVPKAGL